MRLALIVCAGLAGFALPFLAGLFRPRARRLRVSVTLDPHDPSPAALASYFAAVAARLDERPEPMRLVVDARNAERRAVAFDVEPDGRLAIRVAGRRTKHFDLRHRWIADHPVPLALWTPPRTLFARVRARLFGEKVRLFVEPVDANRFRVSRRRGHRPAHPVLLVAASLLAAYGVVCVVPEAVAAALGLAAGSRAA